MNRLFILFLCLLTLLHGVGTADALTTAARDLDQLVTRADTVFKGTVTAQNSQWIGEGTTRHIVTFVSFRVEEFYKGQTANEQTLRFLGGTVGSDTMVISDMPQFQIGQKAVLFVVGNGKQFCPLVGVAQGRFHVVKDEASGAERVLMNNGTPVENTAQIGHVDATGGLHPKATLAAGSSAMSMDDFKRAILGKVAALPR